MKIDLAQFNQLFFEESAEHLAEMERIFLAINPAEPDDEELNAAFRSAHSIKGGAGTFGFPDMTTVTHTMETLLDKIRHREMALTSEMVNVFLKAGDAIGMQLAGHRDGLKVDELFINNICEQLSAISGDIPLSINASNQGVPSPSLLNGKDIATLSTYHITFTAPPNLYTRMVRMEPVFDELEAMGEFVLVGRIIVPYEFATYDPTTCRTIWKITLTTSRIAFDIADVFMFVADEDEICIEQLRSTITPDPAPQQGTFSPVGSVKGARSYDEHETTPGAFGRRPVDHAETSSLRVGVAKVDQLINQMGELVITQAMLAQCAGNLEPAGHENLHRALALLERNTRDLQECVMSIRMVPISFIFNRFQRLVHDLADSLGKQVELKLMGETTELDKGLIEKLADPLTHLVRNCLDHGIELPTIRVAAGKTPGGTITLKAAQQGGRIVVEVSDDGAGLNRERILAKGIQNGLPVSDTMNDEEVWQLIFSPGFSTSDKITDLSGRGVGMDVVQKNVTDMGGRVTISSTLGKGSHVLISLPLTMAILDGLVVRVGGETFIVPVNSVIESLQPRREELNEIQSGKTMVHVREEYIPLIRLGDIFAITDAIQNPENAVVMVIDAEGEHLALLVDELLGQHQVVIKSLETNYRKVAGTTGATILGDGRVALVLDAMEIVHLWRKS